METTPNVVRDKVGGTRKKQCMLILNQLRKGQLWNFELASYALNYTARISNLRAMGHVITCERQTGGKSIYRLTKDADVTAPPSDWVLPQTDLYVNNCGSVVSFRPVTTNGRSWVDENVHTESWQWMGPAFVVDHSFAAALIDGMCGAGLHIREERD